MASPLNRENNKLSITPENQWQAIWSVPFFMIGFTIILFWYDFSEPAIIGVTIAFGVNAFPTLYLHWQYYRQNKGEAYRIFSDRILRYKAGKKEEFLAKDILFITVHLSPALYKGSHFHFLGIEAYYYACVSLEGGEKLLLTCLLDPELDTTLKRLNGVVIRRKKRVFNPL